MSLNPHPTSGPSAGSPTAMQVSPLSDPRPIDVASWARGSHFEHYLTQSPCTYALTTELDVSRLNRRIKETGAKTYAAHIWALTTVINRHDEFRTTLTEQGHPAVWSELHAAFTIFNPDSETFSSVWTPHHLDFSCFQQEMIETSRRYQRSTTLFPQPDRPPNTFDVSSMPWTSFTGFTLHLEGGYRHLLPIITIGQSVERLDGLRLPMAIQLHHATADGFHASRLINEVQALFDDPTWLED
ncbi:CatA-like O-acetyltransferase [Nocardioides sp.]|uniref:CatA-like O-acetyltransferase n=1 Tax=Nocardioides sp. TaxID=35761 RepID=UPI003D13C82D